MQAAYFRLEHSVANKASYDASYMAAHANYCANQNKCSRVIGINMPTNRYHIQGAVDHYAKSLTRKNANLFHKVLLSFPVALSHPHRYQATRRFMMRVTQGRARAVAFFHDQESHNPHAHIMIMDSDVETGKAVARLSANWSIRRKNGLEPNPTEWLRMMWEEECNAVMEENGYGLYIDRRSNLERGLEPPGVHRGYDNDNFEEELHEASPAEEAPSDAPLNEIEQRSLPEDSASIPDEAEDAPEGEEAMAQAHVEYGGVSPKTATLEERVKIGLDSVQEIRYMEACRERRDAAIARYQSAKMMAEKYSLQASHHLTETALKEQALEKARLRYDELHVGGQPKGFRLRLFGRTLWESGTAKQANEAAARLNSAVSAFEWSKADLDALQHTAEVEENRAKELYEKSQREIEFFQNVHGTDEEVASTIHIHRNTVKEYLSEVETSELMVMVEEGTIEAGEAIEVLKVLGREHEAEEMLAAEYENHQVNDT